jgi:hypothetical protein
LRWSFWNLQEFTLYILAGFFNRTVRYILSREGTVLFFQYVFARRLQFTTVARPGVAAAAW